MSSRRSRTLVWHAAAFGALLCLFAGSALAAGGRPSLPHAQATRVMRDMARSHGIPNVHYRNAEWLRQKFPNLAAKGFRHDAVFALNPSSAEAAAFYQQLDAYARAQNLAVVGMGIVSEYNHAFAFAPVTRGGLEGKVMQMDATDPALGSFGNNTKTRIKPAFERPFMNQARALWLIPREPAIEAGNAKFDAAEAELWRGVNCAEFATGLLHHLHKLGVEEFAGFHSANKAVVHATGRPNERGFAAGLVLAVPHFFVMHTNPDWQAWATQRAPQDAKWAGDRAQVQDGHLHTRPLDEGFEQIVSYQDFELF